MQKAHSNINWENYPSEETPVNERNLNKMDAAIDVIDDRVIGLDSTKLDKTTAQTMVKNVEFDESTGIFTITYLSGATATLDTKLEKLAVNFSFNKETQKLVIILDDGTTQEVDLSALITQYEFTDSDTIAFQIDSTGKVSAIVKNGSITEEKLQPNYLADVKTEVAKAQNHANASALSATESSNSATESESYAHGGTGTRENEDSDNSKYYYEQAKQISQSLNGIIPMGTVAFADLPTSDLAYGWMYNVSDAFISDERFNDGGGVYYGAGNNVIWVSGDKWDVTAGSSVTGVKGKKESSYRQGNVNFTPEDIGALPEDGNALTATKATQDSNGNNIVDTYQTKTGDTNNNTVAYTSADSTSPTEWTDVVALASGEKHSSILNKISTMFKNLRYLYKMLGTTDISTIGDGTVTGAISGLNNVMFKSIFKQISDTDSIALEKGGYLIFANAFSDNSSDSISGNIKNGNNIIAKSTSSGVSGFGFSCGISLSDYVYVTENATFSFNVYCSGSIAYKNITAIKILK